MHQDQGSPRGPSKSTVSLTSNKHNEKLPEVTLQVEETQGFLPQFKKDIEIPLSVRLEARFPCSESRAKLCSPSQLEWKLDFPGTTRESPLVPRGNLRKTPNVAQQFEKNYEICPSSRDEALLFLQGRDRNPESSLKPPRGGLTPFRPLYGLQEIHVATGEESGFLCLHSR